MKAEEVAAKLLRSDKYINADELVAALTLAQQEARAEREVEVAALRRIERLARDLMPYINHLGDDGDAICSKLRALLEGK